MNMGPYGSEHFQNATPAAVRILFQPNFFLLSSVAVFTNVAYRKFEINHFIFFLKIEIYDSGQWENENCQYVGNG